MFIFCSNVFVFWANIVDIQFIVGEMHKTEFNFSATCYQVSGFSYWSCRNVDSGSLVKDIEGYTCKYCSRSVQTKYLVQTICIPHTILDDVFNIYCLPAIFIVVY